MKPVSQKIVFFLLSVSLSSSRNAFPLTLLAQNGRGGELWSLKFNSADGAGPCSLDYQAFPSKRVRTQQLKEPECERLRTLLANLKKQISEKNISQKPPLGLAAEDEPNYQFEEGAMRFYVNFVPPKECSVSPSGTLGPCTIHQLSPAEAMLLQLRSYVGLFK